MDRACGERHSISRDCLPPPENNYKDVWRLDMEMLTVSGSHECTLEDWQDLLYKANPKLKIVRVKQPGGSVCTMLAAQLQE